MDVDGSGVIEFEEFVKFIAKLNMKQGDVDEEARVLFRR